MKVLLKKVTILDKKSTYYNQQKDILISDGKYSKIADNIQDKEAKQITSNSLFISQSWVDLKADFNDPGHEYNEDLNSGLNLAANSGFGHIYLVPTTSPIVDNKAQVNYILTKNGQHIVELHPMGTITKEGKGESLSEMYDMFQTGASVFTDNTSFLSSGILYRALLYVQNFGGQIVSFPQDKSLSYHGQINEGIASLKTGLRAMPSVGELIQVQRDLSILEYTEGKLHFSGISCAESLNLIRKAKKKGLQVTCDVYVNHLLFNETATLGFDTNHKVFPPYRTEEDRKELWKAISDGTIDCIASNHQPKIADYKDIEFDNADFGVMSLQSFYASLVDQNLKQHADFIEKISSKPREILDFKENTSINLGNSADCTLFDPTITWELNETTNLSKSINSPFYNKKLKGKAIGIIKRNTVHLNK
ncbi:MAG: dihydroorotase [Brumimicrobium sp.]|nr:dihydroorotase [Brumimicrobium sp.]